MDEYIHPTGPKVDITKSDKYNQCENANKCDQCNFASIHAGNMKKHLKRHSGEKPNKCTQCDYAFSQASNLRRHLKTHSGEKLNIYATNVTLPLLVQAIWGAIWKYTAEKSQTNVTNVTMQVLWQAIWGNTLKHTVEKSQTNATNVTMHLFRQAIWGDIWKRTVGKSQRHLKTLINKIILIWQSVFSDFEETKNHLIQLSWGHLKKNHDRGTTFPGYSVCKLNYLFYWFRFVFILAAEITHVSDSIPLIHCASGYIHIHIWPPGSTIGIDSIFGKQMAPPVLITILATRWCHLVLVSNLANNSSLTECRFWGVEC